MKKRCIKLIRKIIQLGVHIKKYFNGNHFYNDSQMSFLVQFRSHWIILSCLNRANTSLIEAKIKNNTNLDGIYKLTIFEYGEFNIRKLDLSQQADIDEVSRYFRFDPELVGMGYKLVTNEFITKLLRTIVRNKDIKSILFTDGANEALISTSILQESFLSVPYNLKIKLPDSDSPIYFKYDYFDFEIHQVVAPLVPERKEEYPHIEMVI